MGDFLTANGAYRYHDAKTAQRLDALVELVDKRANIDREISALVSQLVTSKLFDDWGRRPYGSATWEDIALALRVTKQAAWRKYSSPVNTR